MHNVHFQLCTSVMTFVQILLFLPFSVFLSLGITVFILFECTPVILDAVAPMNVSRPRRTELFLEFFIDKQQYFFIYITYEFVVLAIGIGTMAITGSFLIAIGSHSCAEFKIAR